jgi:hypothetical protein
MEKKEEKQGKKRAGQATLYRPRVVVSARLQIFVQLGLKL